MEGSLIDLSRYRLERAVMELGTARELIRGDNVAASVNRSYYAIFHALRAVTALDGFDSRKHSGIIAYFNRTYVKTGIFDRTISRLIDTAFRLREKADYQDFYVISNAQAMEQLDNAEAVIGMLSPYLEDRWKNMQDEHRQDGKDIF